MKLYDFALGLTLGVVILIGYVTFQSEKELDIVRERIEANEKKMAALEMAKPSAEKQQALPELTVEDIKKVRDAEQDFPAGLPGEGLTVPKTVAEAEKAGLNTNTLMKLTPTQEKIRSAPEVAMVQEVVLDQGFVTLRFATGQSFAVGSELWIRTEYSILAKLKITTVEGNEAIADIDFKSLASGVKPKASDSVIAPVQSL
jgi:hypothetical protein